MSYDNDIEEAILWALEMNGINETMTLLNLIGWIDLRLRILVSLPELNDALQTLISEGKIQEIKHFKYSLSHSDNSNKKEFTSISESEYEKAVENYKIKLDKALAELEEEEKKFGVSRKLITIIWTIGEREFNNAMEDILNRLAEKLELVLEKERLNKKIIKPESLLLDGIELRSSPQGNEIIIWIQGYDEDKSIDIYNKVKDILRNFDPPFGALKAIVHPLNKDDILFEFG